MTKKKSEKLTEAINELKKLDAEYEAALNDYKNACYIDKNRTDGSERQDRLHEQRMESCRENLNFAKEKLDRQKEVVASLEQN